MIKVEKPVRVENYLLEEGDFLEVLYKDPESVAPHYEEFLEYCTTTHYGELLYEGKMSDALVGIVDFIKKLASEVKYKIKDLFKLFTDKKVFLFFSNLKWDYDSFLKLVSAGSKVATTILNPLGALINIIFPDLGAKAIGKLSKTEFMKKMKESSDKIGEWLKKHKSALVFSSVAFAGLYLIIWLTMNNTGDLAYDFDISDLVGAITGKFTFLDFITSEDGIRQLILFFLAVGGVGNSTIIANLVSSTTQLIVSLIRVLAEKLRMKVNKGESTEQDEEDLLKGSYA